MPEIQIFRFLPYKDNPELRVKESKRFKKIQKSQKDFQRFIKIKKESKKSKRLWDVPKDSKKVQKILKCLKDSKRTKGTQKIHGIASEYIRYSFYSKKLMYPPYPLSPCQESKN